ncbi:MAG TPA: urease accessory protein UreD [Planctomycetaceae bacterium]|nr:urease accessory protein UreD [Planctomycetaceae bacterium]
MGPSAVRIAAEDFVIPPEFRDLALASRSAGQIGGTRLSLINSDGRTRVGDCYQQVPIRVLPAFHLGNEPASLVYLLNPTAGLMDGDGHFLEISAASGTKTVVTSQSATRMHPCPKNFSAQEWHIHAARDSELVVLPGPAIPFASARSYQSVEVDLEEGAHFIWAEIWHPGRYDRGDLSERFQFTSLIQETHVRRAGRLVFRDRFHWRGPWNAKTIQWQMGPHLAAGSLFVTRPANPSALEDLVPSPGPELESAILPLASGDILIRLVGSPAEVTDAVIRAALALAGHWSGKKDPPPWLLESHALATNHWFSSRPAAAVRLLI